MTTIKELQIVVLQKQKDLNLAQAELRNAQIQEQIDKLNSQTETN